MLRKPGRTRGFTIIEVVIVLAIAGLIFAVVFVAVPQLQAAQRDSARGDAMGRFEAAVTQYQSHNSGDLPSVRQARNDLIPNYLNGEFSDPIGGDYTVIRTGSRSRVSYEDAVVSYVTKYICRDDGSGRIRRGGTRNYALMYELEQGGHQCRDNQ